MFHKCNLLMILVVALIRPSMVAAQETDVFGDPLPKDAFARLGTVRLRHADNLLAMAFSLDATLVATGGFDKYLYVWERASGKRVRHWQLTGARPYDLIMSVAFSPDGKRLAGGRLNNGTSIWDMATGKEICREETVGIRAEVLAFSPDGKWLALAGRPKIGGPERPIYFVHPQSGRPRRMFAGHRQLIHGLAFSPDGKLLASASKDGTACLWEVATRKSKQRLLGHAGAVMAIAFSKRGNKLVTTGNDGTVRVWDTATGKQLHCLDCSDWPVSKYALKPKLLRAEFLDEQSLLVCRPAKVYLWDLKTGKHRSLGQLDKYGIDIVAFSKDKTLLAYTQRSGQVVRFWNQRTNKTQPVIPGPEDRTYFIAFTPDGRHIATGNLDGTLRLWQTRTGKMLRTLSPFGPIVFTSDGCTLISGGRRIRDGKIYFWDWQNGRKQRSFVAHATGVQSCALSADGKLLATTGTAKDGKYYIKLWNPATGRLLHNMGGPQPAPTYRVAFTPDGGRLVSLHFGGEVVVWDPQTGRRDRKWHAHTRLTTNVAFFADGKRMVTCGEDTFIRIWDITTGEQIRQWPASKSTIKALALSPDDRTILSSGRNDDTIHVWEVYTGGKRMHLSGHHGDLDCAAFSPDGKVVATGSRDTTVLLWAVNQRPKTKRVKPLNKKELDTTWRDLGDGKANVGYQAMQLLLTRPQEAIPFLQKKLPPIPAPPSAQKVQQLLKQLDHKRFAIRSKATRQLEQHGEAIENTLRKALQQKLTLESHQRILQILSKTTGDKSRRLQILRGVEVLEIIGDGPARQWLKRLATGAPAALLTQEAQVALTRLKG